MTDDELYTILTSDETAVKYLKNNNYKSLYKYIFAQYPSIAPYELSSFLINADIDIFADGEVTYGAYYGAKGLKEFDFSPITKIERFAFRETGLVSADLRTVKEIGDAAFYDSGLEEVYLKMGVKIGSAAFAKCKFNELYIPENTIIGNSAFASCTQLKTVALNGTEIQIGDDAFNNCRHIDEIYIPVDRFYYLGELLHNSKATDIYVGILASSGSTFSKEDVIDYIDRNTHIEASKVKITVEEVKM